MDENIEFNEYYLYKQQQQNNDFFKKIGKNIPRGPNGQFFKINKNVKKDLKSLVEEIDKY